MKVASVLIAIVLAATSANVFAASSKRKDAVCGELAEFLASVRPDERRTVTLHTFWGAREKATGLLSAPRAANTTTMRPAVKLCAYLMENSSTEFSGYNTKRVLACLAPRPGLPNDLRINSGSFSTSYGSRKRGALVDIDLYPDKEPGGMALRLTADGY